MRLINRVRHHLHRLLADGIVGWPGGTGVLADRRWFRQSRPGGRGWRSQWIDGWALAVFHPGGLRINTEGEVLNTDYQPIRGLYAAGELVGGLFYFNYPGGSGLMSGTVFGKIAGTSAGRAGKN